MQSKYPIVLVHGIAAKQLKVINAFGQIGSQLEKEGYKVFIADTDGFGSVENNAEQFEDVVCAVGDDNALPMGKTAAAALPSTIDGEREELPG